MSTLFEIVWWLAAFMGITLVLAWGAYMLTYLVWALAHLPLYFLDKTYTKWPHKRP